MAHSIRAVNNFMFHTTKSIWCEVGSSKHLGRLVSEQIARTPNDNPTVLCISDKGITSRGLELGSFQDLAQHGYNVVLYDDVVPDPPESCVIDAVNLAKEIKADYVIGFGGGSPLDVAKLVSFLAHPNAHQSLNDIYGVEVARGERLPLIQVPTTAGTGSEVTPIAIITTGENEKKGVVSPILLPDFAVLDGALTTTLPSNVTAATGIDAMVHAIEAYTSRFKKNPLSDILAKDALRLLGGNIKTVCAQPDNLEARSNMLLGSLYAGMSFSNSPVAAVHALAYPIGSHFKVPHGLSNALMLPHVLRFNNEVVSDLYSEIQPILFPDSNKASLADCFEVLANELDVPLCLKDVGIKEDDLSLLTTEAMKQTRLLPNNPRQVEEDDIYSLYKAALG